MFYSVELLWYSNLDEEGEVNINGGCFTEGGIKIKSSGRKEGWKDVHVWEYLGRLHCVDMEYSVAWDFCSD